MGSISASADASSADSATSPAASETSLGVSGVIVEDRLNSLIAETSATSGVCETSGREALAVCSTTGPTDASTTGSARENCGSLGRKTSVVCSTTGTADDSTACSVIDVNSRSDSAL